MTPSLRAVYDELMQRAVQAPWQEETGELRARFTQRCGRFNSDHPAAASRDAASLEHVLIAEGLAARIGASLDDPGERSEAALIASAEPALLVFEDHAGLLVGHDLWSASAWWIAPEDDIGRDIRLQLPDSPVAQCRLVVTDGGCIILPGIVYHPADAYELLAGVLSHAREQRLNSYTLFQALLRMEYRFRTLTRAKLGYAYRPENLRLD